MNKVSLSVQKSPKSLKNSEVQDLGTSIMKSICRSCFWYMTQTDRQIKNTSFITKLNADAARPVEYWIRSFSGDLAWITFSDTGKYLPKPCVPNFTGVQPCYSFFQGTPFFEQKVENTFSILKVIIVLF